jgi:hypothetical protein
VVSLAALEAHASVYGRPIGVCSGVERSNSAVLNSCRVTHDAKAPPHISSFSILRSSLVFINHKNVPITYIQGVAGPNTRYTSITIAALLTTHIGRSNWSCRMFQLSE